MIYASMEIPKLFSIVNPQDGNATEVNLDASNFYMAAAGPLRPDMGPNKHRQANVAANMISMNPAMTTTTSTTTTTESGASTTTTTTTSSENGANRTAQSWFTLAAFLVMILFKNGLN